MSTDVAILGGREITLPVGWTRQRLISVLGGADVDATAAPGADAELTFIGVFGGASVRVPEGARVSIGGFAFLGGRRVKVSSSETGPAIKVNAYSLLGGLEIRDR